MVKSKDQVLSLLREAKPELKERFGINRLALFGSYAKGTATAKSDVDVLYYLAGNRSQTLTQVLDLDDFLKELLEVDKVDAVNNDYLNPIIGFFIEDSLEYV